MCGREKNERELKKNIKLKQCCGGMETKNFSLNSTNIFLAIKPWVNNETNIIHVICPLNGALILMCREHRGGQASP